MEKKKTKIFLFRISSLIQQATLAVEHFKGTLPSLLVTWGDGKGAGESVCKEGVFVSHEQQEEEKTDVFTWKQ